jgi:hypothetical protein
LVLSAAQVASAAFLVPNSATPPFGDWSRDPSALTLDFAAESSSMSLDRVAIDTFTTQSPLSLIPEPGTSTLLLIGAAGLGLVHWRRRRAKR